MATKKQRAGLTAILPPHVWVNLPVVLSLEDAMEMTAWTVDELQRLWDDNASRSRLESVTPHVHLGHLLDGKDCTVTAAYRSPITDAWWEAAGKETG